MTTLRGYFHNNIYFQCLTAFRKRHGRRRPRQWSQDAVSVDEWFINESFGEALEKYFKIFIKFLLTHVLL